MKRYSDKSLDVLISVELEIIKTNNQFYSEYHSYENLKEDLNNHPKYMRVKELILNEIENSVIDGFICFYDKDFPVINNNVPLSEKPYILFYKGNIKLLNTLNNNVAVIGLTTPTEQIIKRERSIVEELVSRDLVIVSGLAKGCDEIAHKVSVDNNRPTIAILGSTINKIYPASNRILANEIIDNNGLIITEYFKEPIGRFDSIKRLVDRDRLQAMFSKAVVMISSYRKGQGDSGSRHAMDSANKYQIKRYVMYNEETDSIDSMFSLNRDFLNDNTSNIGIITNKTINEISELVNEQLEEKNNYKITIGKLF